MVANGVSGAFGRQSNAAAAALFSANCGGGPVSFVSPLLPLLAGRLLLLRWGTDQTPLALNAREVGERKGAERRVEIWPESCSALALQNTKCSP